MTATYDITTDVGKVRLTTSDKDLTDVIFTDEEIEVFLDAQSNNIYLASADLMEAWANSYAASAASEKIGDYAYTQKIVENMRNQAKQLRERAITEPSGAAAEMAHT
ncbi:unnamed protein product, partial [marine sediment metagenome]